MRSVAAGQVFDITRSCGADCDEVGNDWLESRLAEPDVVVEQEYSERVVNFEDAHGLPKRTPHFSHRTSWRVCQDDQ